MSVMHPALADLVASLRHAAEADATAARARLDSALQVLILTLIATLAGRLERLALTAHRRATSHPAPMLHARHFTPGPRIARHVGPVPARRLRIGRFPTWFAANRGARALPSTATIVPRPVPARAPPDACKIP